MSDRKWIPTAKQFPEHRQKITWLAPDGSEIDGFYEGGVWFIEGGSMYVYYCPHFWKPREEKEAAGR